MADKKNPALRSTPSLKSQSGLDKFAAAAGKSVKAAKTVYPWEEPHIRDDVKKNIPLRLPEPLYMKLKYIADHTPYSMNSFILEKLSEEIEEELSNLLG